MLNFQEKICIFNSLSLPLYKLNVMKKPNIFLGLVGGILTVAIAPGLVCGGMYFWGLVSSLGGLVIIDWNRNGN